MKAHTMGAVAAALLLIGSLPVVQADDKKEVKNPLTEKYAAKENEIEAARKSGLISKELAGKILNEYEKQLKAVCPSFFRISSQRARKAAARLTS